MPAALFIAIIPLRADEGGRKEVDLGEARRDETRRRANDYFSILMLVRPNLAGSVPGAAMHKPRQRGGLRQEIINRTDETRHPVNALNSLLQYICINWPAATNSFSCADYN